MKQILILVSILFSYDSISQTNIQSAINTPEQPTSTTKYRSVQSIENADTLDLIWYEDFREGLDGNNSSIDPAWTTSGNDADVWQYDLDGSNGDYAGDDPYVIESESAANGFMIFDADGSNAGLPVSAYSEKKGQLTSPYIDLSNDSNVTLSFEHAYRWCCFSSHELVVSINDGSGWEAASSFQVNELGTVNVLSGTVKVEIIITEIAALKDSVQVRFDWALDEETASHYFWMIDDVKIIKTQAYASNILTSYNRVPSTYFGGTSYRVMPFEQISSTAYFFGGIVENVGYNNLDSVRIYAEIDNDQFSSQSDGVSILSASKDTMFTNDGFTPSAVGDYTASIYGKDENGDESYNIMTDTLIQNFSVSEYIYARDNGDNANSFGRYTLNGDGSRQYGNIFDIYTTSTLYSVKLRLDERTTANALGSIRINTVDPTSGEVSFLTESEQINLGEHTGEWFDVSFDPPLILDAGQVILPTVFANYNGVDTVFMSTSGSNPNNGESLVQDIDGIQDGIDPGTWLYTTFAPCVRLNFDPSIIGVNVGLDEKINLADFQIYPNPNNGKFNISINDNLNRQNIVVIKNIIGQTVYSEIASNSSINSFDLSKLKKGIYMVSLVNEQIKISTKKIIIK